MPKRSRSVRQDELPSSEISLDPPGTRHQVFFDQDKSLPPMNGPALGTIAADQVEAIVRRVREEMGKTEPDR